MLGIDLSILLQNAGESLSEFPRLGWYKRLFVKTGHSWLVPTSLLKHTCKTWLFIFTTYICIICHLYGVYYVSKYNKSSNFKDLKLTIETETETL